MRHYKFIHFLWHPSTGFNPRLVKMITTEYGFSPEEHLFVTPYKELFDKLPSSPNVILYKTNTPFSAKMVNEFAPYGDWLFIHCIPYWQKAFFIKNKNLKKIIWRTWGSDAVLWNVNKGSATIRILKKVLNCIRKRMVQCFFAVGTSSSYIDCIDVTQHYGAVKIFEMPYADDNEFFLKDSLLSDSHQTLNIMLGHSGIPQNNHINILNHLKRFKNQNIRIFLLLSYGDIEYINKVIQYVKNDWTEKIEIITNRMPLDQFNEFCKKMDVCILDGCQSYAIGNVSSLASMRKKFVFNRNGLWHKAFSDKKYPHMCTDELVHCSFEELKKPVVFEKDYYEGIENKPYKDKIQSWKRMFEELSQTHVK